MIASLEDIGGRFSLFTLLFPSGCKLKKRGRFEVIIIHGRFGVGGPTFHKWSVYV